MARLRNNRKSPVNTELKTEEAVTTRPSPVKVGAATRSRTPAVKKRALAGVMIPKGAV